MAIRLKEHTRLLLASLTLLPLVNACVSTEELYAQYDVHSCEVDLSEPRIEGATLAFTQQLWNPAVYFDYDEHELDEEGYALLESTAEIMNKHKELNVGLQGFADRIGGISYNIRLSGRRVETVTRYLTERGIEPSRIVSQPLGEGLPQFGSSDAEARATNRRVELVLLDANGRPVSPLFEFPGL